MIIQSLLTQCFLEVLLGVSRPDIAYGVSLIRRYMESPRKSLWKMEKEFYGIFKEHTQKEFFIKKGQT